MVAAKHSVAEGRKRVGQAARDATQETLGQLQENASAVYEEGRDKLQRAEHTLDQYIRERPLKSVLIAAGIGLLVGRFWRR